MSYRIKKNTVIKAIVILSMTSLFLTFQNCSDVEFSNSIESFSVVTNFGVEINSGSEFTGSQQVNLSLKAEGAVAIYVTDDPTCETGGEWLPYQNSKEFRLNNESLNGPAEVFVKFRSIDEIETACISDDIIHDSIPPRVDWFNRPMQSGVFSAQNYDVDFDLMEQGSGVKKVLCKVDDTIKDCASVRSVQVKNAKQGLHRVTVVAFDRAGNMTEEDISWRVVSKLGLVSFSINGGKQYTQNKSVTLDFVAENATSMKISEDSSCISGKVENFSVSKKFSLKSENDTNKVYAQFYNEAGDKSPCLLASVLHDDIKPVINLQDAPAFKSLLVKDLSTGAFGIDEQGSGISNYKCSLNAKKVDCSIGSNLKSILSEGEYKLRIETTDRAGNASIKEFVFNRLYPLGQPQMRIKQNSMTNHPDGMVDLLLAAANAKEVFISNEVNCSQGSWEHVDSEKKWRLKSLNSMNTVYAKFRNTDALVSECINASILHDNTPYVLSLVNAQSIYELTDKSKRHIYYTVYDDKKKLKSFADVAKFEGCVAENEDSGKQYELECDNFGVVSLESLEPGSYNLVLSFLDKAKNKAVLEHSFNLNQGVYLCDDPLYVKKGIKEKCLALYDNFERAKVDGDSQFNWKTLIDDVIREDSVNVQANIFQNGQHGFGEAASGSGAAFFTGRLGGSVHEIYMISKPLDLSKFTNFEILFNYLPVGLEEYSWKGKEGIEHIRIDICTSTDRNCGLDESRGYNNRVKALKSTNWKSIFVQDGYDRGNLTNKEKGLGNSGRNHKKDSWLEGRVELDLDSSLIYDQSKVTVRVTILLDEGFSKADKDKNPYFSSDLKDAIGIDNFRFFAGY